MILSELAELRTSMLKLCTSWNWSIADALRVGQSTRETLHCEMILTYKQAYGFSLGCIDGHEYYRKACLGIEIDRQVMYHEVLVQMMSSSRFAFNFEIGCARVCILTERSWPIHSAKKFDLLL